MAEPTIKNGEEQFFPILYEGNGAGQRVGKFVPFTNNGTIANSLIFNDGDSAYLTRTPSSSGSATTFTISAWVKFGVLGTSQELFGNAPSGSAASILTVLHYTDNTIYIQGFTNGGSYTMNLQTSRTFEDTSKWYHILIAFDTTQSTSTDRVKMYVDGTLQSMQSTTYPGQNENFGTNQSGIPCTIGRYNYDATRYFDGYMAEINMVDGTALTPSTFGVTDTSTGRWIPKTLSGITYGTNGFRLQFLDSTHAGIDTSGNGNTFTATNLIESTSQPIAMGGTAFDTGSAGAWDGSYPVANGFTESTSTQAIYNDGSTAVGGVIGWDFGSGRSANIQTIKINQLAVNNSITGFTFEYSDNGSDYTSVGTFSVTAATSTQTVSVLNTAGKHRYWRLKSTTNTTGGQSSYRWVVAFLGFFSQPVTTDSPTQNFPTVNISGPYIGSQQSAAEGNLKIVMTAGFGYPTVRVHKEIPQSGKWYWEVKAEKVGNIVGIQNAPYGVLDLNLIDANQLTVGNPFTRHIGGMGVEMYSGAIFTGLYTSAGKSATDFTIGSTSMGDNDYIVFAFDMDNGKAWWGFNDSSAGSSVVWFANDGGTDGNPSTGANPTVTFTPSNHRFVPAQGGFAPGGSDGAGSTYASNFIYNFGSKAFAFTAPTGFSALSQNNFPETDKGVSGLVWSKNRDSTDNHTLMDSSRGASQRLESTETGAQTLVNDSLNKFLVGGQQIGSYADMNRSDNSFVSWNWVCNGGTTETNTDGDTIVTLQKNTTAGFSIGTFTSKVAEQTCGHGLGVKPDFILLKRLDGSQNWMAYHSALSSSDAYYLHLNNTDATQTGSDFGNDVPTSTVFHTNVTGTAGRSYCFWAWNSVEGYSKFGKYEGNNSADGTFVYLGFKPAFVMIKGIDSSSSSYPWAIYDNRRSPTNPVSLFLEANSTAVENNLDRIDFLSNGFKLRQAYSYSNAGETYVYVAFAEHPFVGDGTSPVTAR